MLIFIFVAVMKKLFAVILLLCHMNASMFLPQVGEDDVFDKNGAQADDINSVVEFFQVQFGYDHTSDDEDSDSGQNFHLVKVFDYNFDQVPVIIITHDFSENKKLEFADYCTPALTFPCFDILTPPPNAV